VEIIVQFVKILLEFVITPIYRICLECILCFTTSATKKKIQKRFSLRNTLLGLFGGYEILLINSYSSLIQAPIYPDLASHIFNVVYVLYNLPIRFP